MICCGGELKYFTIRNKLAAFQAWQSEGIVVRVSNVTSVGKAVAIMQLAQEGLHLLSETKQDESISKRLHLRRVVFPVKEMNVALNLFQVNFLRALCWPQSCR